MNPQRPEIDGALVAGTSYRNIAERFGTSLAAIFRHKLHAGQAIVKAAERREEQLGDNLLDEMSRAQRKAWELLGKAEADGDVRGAIVALREARECVATLGDMLSRAAETASAQDTMTVRVIHLGKAATHEWEELPASYAALLPGKPKGKLYIVREHGAHHGVSCEAIAQRDDCE